MRRQQKFFGSDLPPITHAASKFRVAPRLLWNAVTDIGFQGGKAFSWRRRYPGTPSSFCGAIKSSGFDLMVRY